MSKPILIAASLTALAAAGAQAQTAPADTPNPPDRAGLVKQLDEGFDRVDLNNDGFLSRDEVAGAAAKAVAKAQETADAKLSEEFAKLDADKNGQLSLAEFKAAARLRAKTSPDEALNRLDANKDGKISEAEFKNRTLAQFDALDANKDGRLSAEEQAKARSR